MRDEGKVAETNAAEGQKPGKRRVVRKTFKVLFLPLTMWFYFAKRLLGHLLWLLGMLWHFISKEVPRLLREEKSNVRQAMAEEKQRPAVSRREVLEAWGVVDETTLHQKNREWTFHLLIWFALMGLGFVSMVLHDGSLPLFGIAIVLVTTAGILSTLWRKFILTSDRFIYFSDWLRGRI